MIVTRLLPYLIALAAIIGLAGVVPIVIRELLYPYRRTRELDEWLDDIYKRDEL